MLHKKGFETDLNSGRLRMLFVSNVTPAIVNHFKDKRREWEE